MNYCIRLLLALVILFAGMARASSVELGMPDCAEHHHDAPESTDAHHTTPADDSQAAPCTHCVCDCDCPLCKYSDYLILMLPSAPDTKAHDVAVIAAAPPTAAPGAPARMPLLRPPNS